MIQMRTSKTTPNADDFKVLFVGIVCAIVIMVGSNILTRLQEHRWYRDLVHLTPFHEVQLLYSSVGPQEIEITIGGSLIKRRCEFNNLFGYIHADNGIRYRVPVDTDAEIIQGNRPPSDSAESWGPWRISTDDNPNFPVTAMPVKWEVIAEHIECPTEPVTQRNFFVGGEWEDFVLVQENGLDIMQNIIEEERL